MTKEQILAVDRLIKTNADFCVYKKPGRAEICLALGESPSSSRVKTDFIIAPFVSGTRCKVVRLHKCDWKNVAVDDYNVVPKKKCREVLLPNATTKDVYLENIQKIKDKIAGGFVKKVVLSHVILMERSTGIDVVELFAMLAERYPNTFTYLFHGKEDGFWLGATPELLLRKMGRHLTTNALAGTQKRTINGEYHWREKEIEEHAMVEQHVENIFAKHGIQLEKKEGPDTIESGKVAHLKTIYHYLFDGQENLSELIGDLQPTPAVGGLPKTASLEVIDQMEHYDRGFYTGYIGELDDEGQVDLYVNLRCMQVVGDRIAVYVGGGITADSDAEAEWQETILKSKTLLNIIQSVKETV